MMKRLAAMLTLGVVLALPGTAAAKGPISGLKVCGTNGCAAVPLDKTHGGPISMDVFFGDQGQAVEAPQPGSFYELHVKMGEGTQRWFVLPGFRIIGVDAGWTRISSELGARLRDAATGLAPFEFTVTGVAVDNRSSKDVAVFAPLFRLPPGDLLASEAYKHSGQWVTIDGSTSRTTPWGELRAYYDPVLRAASVNGHQWGALPPRMADHIDAALGVNAPPVGSNGSSMLPWAAAAGSALAGAGVLLLFAWRRRGRGRPAPVA